MGILPKNSLLISFQKIFHAFDAQYSQKLRFGTLKKHINTVKSRNILKKKLCGRFLFCCPYLFLDFLVILASVKLCYILEMLN